MPRGIPQLVALFALLAALPARAAPPANGGSSAPQLLILKTPDAQEREDPKIGKPADPGVDCLTGDLSLQEQANLKESHVSTTNKSCLPQADSFRLAAEAASYLAIYQQNFSQFGRDMLTPARKKEIQDAVDACVNNDPKCDHSYDGRKMRSDLFKALVQYNFGKDLKAQMIENQTRAANMKNMEASAKPDRSQGPGGMPAKVLNWRNSLHSAPVRERSFRLDPRQVEIYDPTNAQERARLGQDFNATFDSFVNEYTSSTGQRGPKSRWHYVEAKTSALEGQGAVVAAYDNRNLDARQGKAAIYKASLDQDIKTQESATVKEIIEAYRSHRHDALAGPGEQTVNNEGKKVEKKVNVDAMKLAYEDAGFGQDNGQLALIGTPDGPRNPKDVADLVVVSINRALTVREKIMEEENKAQQARFPSSVNNGAKPIFIPSVTVDMKSFDAFLNDIWPVGVPQPPQTN